MNRRRVILASAIIIAGAFTATPAWAAPSADVIQGRVLRLISVADWSDATSMVPGEPVQWDIAVSANAPEPGTVTIALSARGDASLVVDIFLCMQEWEESGCPGGEQTLETGWSIPRDGTQTVLAEFAASDDAHVRLWVRLPDAAAGVTDLRLHAHGAGESIAAGPGGALPATGGSLAPWIVGFGVALAGAGVRLAVARGEHTTDARGRVQ